MSEFDDFYEDYYQNNTNSDDCDESDDDQRATSGFGEFADDVVEELIDDERFEGEFGFGLYSDDDPWKLKMKIALRKVFWERDQAKMRWTMAKSGSYEKKRQKENWEEAHYLHEKLTAALSSEDRLFDFRELDAYLKDKEKPVSLEPRRKTSKEINTPNERQDFGDSVLAGRSDYTFQQTIPECQDLLQSKKVSKNAKKKQGRKEKERNLAQASTSGLNETDVVAKSLAGMKSED